MVGNRFPSSCSQEHIFNTLSCLPFFRLPIAEPGAILTSERTGQVGRCLTEICFSVKGAIPFPELPSEFQPNVNIYRYNVPYKKDHGVSRRLRSLTEWSCCPSGSPGLKRLELWKVALCWLPLCLRLFCFYNNPLQQSEWVTAFPFYRPELKSMETASPRFYDKWSYQTTSGITSVVHREPELGRGLSALSPGLFLPCTLH